jgi:hypothetical protein
MQQHHSAGRLDSEVTPAEADSPYASATDGAVDGATDTTTRRDTTAADADASAEPAPDVAEEYAESISIDPTPEQVEHYLELVGDPEADVDADPPDVDAADAGTASSSKA